MTLRKIKKQFIRFLINIGTSGKYSGKRSFGMSDYLIRYALLNFIILFGITILAVFTVLNLRLGRYLTAVVCIGMIMIALTSFTLARTKIRQSIPAFILMIFYGLLCVMVTWIGDAQGANFLFMYMYPSLTIMLLGMRSGVTLSVILLTLISLEMFIPGVSRFDYSFDFSIRMLVNYILVLSVTTVIESTRKTKDRMIDTQTRRLHELRKEAEAANRTKSNFLASMSHEIRTPMNAIIGMAELLLRKNLPDDARGDIQDIKQAGGNLISIINDILDFSKIEAGKLEIIPVKYMLSSLVNDTVNIIRMRIGEKPLRFFTNIDGLIPNSLIGDEVRLRQIFLNLLSNAIKYSEKGHISLTITVKDRVVNRVWLKVAVSDTGKGIKPEDRSKLFGEFTQVDTEKNRGIEGTGLGLAITRRLCLAMGGDISVESEYGVGSTFTAIIPQGIESEAPFAKVEDPEKKMVLIYERRIVYSQSVSWSLNNMCVPYKIVTNPEDFADALFHQKWFYVFSGCGLYETIKPLMERPDSEFPSGKKPSMALMGEWENEAYIPNVRFVSLPVQSLSIANILNDKPDERRYFDNSGSGNLLRFTFPAARLLVVDDIATNLKVAEGLLAPYGASVDTCLNAREAIELVKNRDYDIVFMDHMMPDLDGIEAAAIIREWEAEEDKGRGRIPIIALTANVVSGMMEMFIEKGFSDFLAKPIDVSKLDAVLDHWIPKEKREQGVGNGDHSSDDGISPVPSPQSLFNIPGVDVQRGIAMTGGKVALYKRVLTMFCKDAEERLPLLKNLPNAEALPAFVTQVHALKSASASIGAAEVSTGATGLEAAGKAGDLAFIWEKLPGFAEALAELVKGIDNALKTDATTMAVIPAMGSLIPVLRELETALQSQKVDDIDRILEDLFRQPLGKDKKATLEEISDEVLIAEYEKAGQILSGLLDMDSRQ